MALLVDPPPRDNAGGRPSAEVSSDAPDGAATVSAAQVVTEPEPVDPTPSDTAPTPSETAERSEPRLAEPPLTGDAHVDNPNRDRLLIVGVTALAVAAFGAFVLLRRRRRLG